MFFLPRPTERTNERWVVSNIYLMKFRRCRPGGNPCVDRTCIQRGDRTNLGHKYDGAGGESHSMNAPLKRTILGGTEKVQARGFTSLLSARDCRRPATECLTYLSRNLCILVPFYMRLVMLWRAEAHRMRMQRIIRLGVPPGITLRAIGIIMKKTCWRRYRILKSFSLTLKVG